MPPVELSGPQKRELRLALIHAFPSWNDLRRLTSDQWDVALPTISAQSSPLEDNAFDLVEWAGARGRAAELLVAARNQNPENPKLQDLAARLSVSAATALPAGSLEKVVSRNNVFLDVAKWRAALTRAEWRVCRMDVDGIGEGTGFLIGPDLVLTNYHVMASLIQGRTDLASWSCRFDYKVTESGQTISDGRSVAFAKDWLIDTLPYSPVDEMADPKPRDPTDEELDFALVRLAERIGEEPVGKGEQSEPREWVRIPEAAIDYGAIRSIAILQHPNRKPMKLALDFEQNITVAGGGRRIRYTVPTDNGSSGSPVFDGDWNLIALHHSGDPRTKNPEYNEAIPIALIAARPKVAAALGA